MGQTLNPSDLPGTVNGNDSTTEENRSDSSQSKTSSSSSSSSSASGKVREKSLAFTVPGDEGDASLIRKHPPLRFRRLEDQQVEISQEIINNKQAEAEKRRTAVSVSSSDFPQGKYFTSSASDHPRESKECQIFQCENEVVAGCERAVPGRVRS